MRRPLRVADQPGELRLRFRGERRLQRAEPSPREGAEADLERFIQLHTRG